MPRKYVKATKTKSAADRLAQHVASQQALRTKLVDQKRSDSRWQKAFTVDDVFQSCSSRDNYLCYYQRKGDAYESFNVMIKACDNFEAHLEFIVKMLIANPELVDHIDLDAMAFFLKNRAQLTQEQRAQIKRVIVSLQTFFFGEVFAAVIDVL